MAPKNFLFVNIKKVLAPNIQFDIIEQDFHAAICRSFLGDALTQSPGRRSTAVQRHALATDGGSNTGIPNWESSWTRAQS